MLTAIYKEHQEKQNVRKQELEKRRNLAVDSTNKFSTQLLNQLNEKVAEAYVNQKQIDAKIKTLNQNTTTLLKQTQQWIQTLDGFNTALKELGDVENWSKKIETDMKIISTTLNSTLNKQQ